MRKGMFLSREKPSTTSHSDNFNLSIFIISDVLLLVEFELTKN